MADNVVLFDEVVLRKEMKQVLKTIEEIEKSGAIFMIPPEGRKVIEKLKRDFKTFLK